MTHQHPVRPTKFIPCPALSERVNADVTLASETFQQTGSFKFRAAYHLASHMPNAHLAASSSGNFGQALALACRMLGKRCTIVMPGTSARVKVDAVRRYGATVRLIDTATVSRAQALREIAAADPDVYSTNAYDNALIIAGNASLGREIGSVAPAFDAVIVPVGGGGLSSGVIVGLRELGVPALVYGAEPEIANDAARSLRAGRIIANESEPQTIADGARTISLGALNWPILNERMAGILEASEAEIRSGVRFLFREANLKAEPTGALSVAALLRHPDAFRGQRVCCVVSGGNVDPSTYASIIQEPAP